MNDSLLILYKNYPHCLDYVQEFENKYGDADTLGIFEDEIKKYMKIYLKM